MCYSSVLITTVIVVFKNIINEHPSVGSSPGESQTTHAHTLSTEPILICQTH